MSETDVIVITDIQKSDKHKGQHVDQIEITTDSTELSQAITRDFFSDLLRVPFLRKEVKF